ncbi:SymE family type I addiction module toxin [Fibrella aquatilis]|uniref:SymE family type I addiction module toxin n=1 Tax=Fibrella aquatilis TaxID=2817059 RepID=A0A939GC15_9BACT|nr:SymE family type I addiction module toxin [Fibrella aquatilis]MBO0933921.1 SymE family type I addiction module toxin [Fibrella aquatilis]
MQSKRKIGSMTRRDARYKLVWMPALQLAGKWMSEAGFATGQQVTVSVEAGKITIQL